MITDREVFEILRNHGYAVTDIKNWMNKKQQADLRDELAGKVITGICSHNDTWGLTSPEIVRQAYEIADIALKVRSEDKGETK